LEKEEDILSEDSMPKNRVSFQGMLAGITTTPTNEDKSKIFSRLYTQISDDLKVMDRENNPISNPLK
jgi:hypothetical protein